MLSGEKLEEAAGGDWREQEPRKGLRGRLSDKQQHACTTKRKEKKKEQEQEPLMEQ